MNTREAVLLKFKPRISNMKGFKYYFNTTYLIKFRKTVASRFIHINHLYETSKVHNVH